MTRGERRQLTQVSAFWVLSAGGQRKQSDATSTAHSRWGQGTRNPSPLVSLPHLLARVGLVFTQRQLWGSSKGTHGTGATRWGRTGGPRYVKCVHFQRKRREVIWVWGWPWKEGLAPCLGRQRPPPGFGLQGPCHHHEGREPREGGKTLLDPIKGQRSLTLCLEIPA